MKKKRLILFILFVTILFSLILTLYKIGPEKIVNLIGVENTYIIIFIVAVIGGVSAITSTSFYALFITFILGGANPILLAIIGGIGLTIGDSAFFYLGYKGREVAIKTKYKEKIEKFTHWLQSHSKKFTSMFIYIYVSFSPLPKDILSSTLAIGNYSFKRAILLFLLGNITHGLTMAWLIIYLS